ncbi:hypothetical protein ACPA54_04600 [Uniformispora flossi]|uniref:hypothetical protein n=1 Tax=Uniformispora flossi TaxID=3390723 RepID=UPI003C2D9DCC
MMQETTPLPNRDRHRFQLLAAIDHLETSRTRRHRYAAPAIATAAVIVAGSVGFVALDRDAGTPRPTSGAAGQGSTAGVDKEHARPGDPVPMAVAKQVLKTCFGFADEVVKGPPQPTPSGTGIANVPTRTSPTGTGGTASVPNGAGAGSSTALPASPGSLPPDPSGLPEVPRFPQFRASPPSSTGIDGGNRTGPSTMRNLLVGAHGPWDLPEAESSYRPFFTAWESDGAGGLNPYVLAKADGPGLLLCRGPEARPNVPAMVARTPWLYEPIEAERLQVSAPMDADMEFPLLADTNWGRAIPDVVRVTVTYSGGTVVDAVVRDGVWFASTPAAAFADPKRARDEIPIVTAYDAAGKELYKIPDSATPLCYRTPDNTLLAYRADVEAKPDPASCDTAHAWTGASSS